MSTYSIKNALGRLLVIAALTALPALGAVAGDVYVICNSGVTLQPGEVRDVFIGEKGFAGAVKLVPVDNGALQADFLGKVLKLDSAKYSGIWTKKSFRDGATPPAVKGSDGEVTAFVKATAGACGYVSSSPAGVAVVGKF